MIIGTSRKDRKIGDIITVTVSHPTNNFITIRGRIMATATYEEWLAGDDDAGPPIVVVGDEKEIGTFFKIAID